MGGNDLLQVGAGDPVDLSGDRSITGRVDCCWQSLRDGVGGHIHHCTSFDRQCRREGDKEKEKGKDKSVGLNRHVIRKK